MKSLIFASSVGLSLIPSAWADGNINIHEHVNNAQAAAHQQQFSSVPESVRGEVLQMKSMDQHEQALNVHNSMKNGASDAHQKMAKNHQKMSDDMAGMKSSTAPSFAEMDEHERAAVAHENMSNGQSEAHQSMAAIHRGMK
ncbi:MULTISPECIES: hypothetical protein [Pantoea]|uniref:Silver-binding protein SilE n=1 Tax=Pantoea brenneri TaxID=472694 RepID=A0AAX3JA36_9GAMM|nr:MULTISPECIES: hypothetical protein [Pantoea]KIC86536.1 copper-binding protein [Pantoea agglomerans]KNH27327.1 copper-binding protein [Pantoea vagans]MBA5702502.1 copper-binding protein [Pantoea agglomerans]MCT2420289.1 copper-binding protein [Pantoea sp. XY16]MDH2069627.1 copper-binding protein [Pantoea sp. GD03673]